MHTVYILGTDHGYQTHDQKFSQAQHADFDAYLRRLVSKLSIQTIAEEASCEGVRKKRISETTVKSVARSLDVVHAYCDPEQNDRAKQGIGDIADLFALRFTSDISEAQSDQKIVESNRLREQFWLNRVETLTKWPILFVCGAKHSKTFCDAVKSKGYESIVVEEDWKSHAQ